MYKIRLVPDSYEIHLNNMNIRYVSFDRGSTPYKCTYSHEIKRDEIGMSLEHMLINRFFEGDTIQALSFDAPPHFELDSIEFECTKPIDLVKFKEMILGHIMIQYQFFKFSDAIVRVFSKSRGIVTRDTLMSQHTLGDLHDQA
jgi:hypothetical protein